MTELALGNRRRIHIEIVLKTFNAANKRTCPAGKPKPGSYWDFYTRLSMIT